MVSFRKSWVLVVVSVVVVGGVWLLIAARGDDTPPLDTFVVERRDLERVVAATGTVTPADDVALAFAVSGRIARVDAAIGDRVVRGAVLAALDATDLGAARAQASAARDAERAALAELRMGTRAEEIAVAETARTNALRALDDAERTERNVRAKADSDLAVAYDDAPNILRDAYADADDAVRKQTDELFTNDATANPQTSFKTSDFQAEIDVERRRADAEAVLVAWPSRLALVDAADHAGLDALLRTMDSDLEVIRAYLERAAAAVNGATDIAQTTVNTYKANLATARGEVNTARAAVDDSEQTIATQRLTSQQTMTKAEADRTTAQNALDAADAALRLAQAKATPEQIAAQEALVAKAEAAVAVVDADLAQTALHAPFDGMVTVQDARVGAIATAGARIITLISDAAFTLEVRVPEVDLAGLAPGQTAAVVLDAYGADVAFPTTVATIDPAATLIEGVPTYRTVLVFVEEDARIRSGMTADVTIAVDARSGVLAVPQRALVREDGSTSVKVLRNGVVEHARIITGLKSSDGYIEVLEGLAEGDIVVRP